MLQSNEKIIDLGTKSVESVLNLADLAPARACISRACQIMMACRDDTFYRYREALRSRRVASQRCWSGRVGRGRIKTGRYCRRPRTRLSPTPSEYPAHGQVSRHAPTRLREPLGGVSASFPPRAPSALDLDSATIWPTSRPGRRPGSQGRGQTAVILTEAPGAGKEEVLRRRSQGAPSTPIETWSPIPVIWALRTLSMSAQAP